MMKANEPDSLIGDPCSGGETRQPMRIPRRRREMKRLQQREAAEGSGDRVERNRQRRSDEQPAENEVDASMRHVPRRAGGNEIDIRAGNRTGDAENDGHPTDSRE